ncbi:hypothetical protein R1sor_001188 [Riccia sorocarpa]|uniref:Serine hydrolase domain-containing protein n=1 Tax=Riccia sorocarpa TaxID=122646 RepID=A0ABD3GWX2_9MARC
MRLLRWLPVLHLFLVLFAVQALGSSAEGKRLRVLALHGYMGNGNVMCESFNSWDPAILKLVQFTCLDAPFADKYYKNAYSWLNFDSDRSRSKIDQSLAYLFDFMRQTGPYDGVWGFSQGGVMAGLLTGVQAKKMDIWGRKSGDLPPLRFTVVHAGGYVPGLLEYIFSPPLETKSFHIIGNYDPVRQGGINFLSKWQNPMVAYVDMPHTYLTSQYMDDNLKWSLEYFLKNV